MKQKQQLLIRLSVWMIIVWTDDWKAIAGAMMVMCKIFVKNDIVTVPHDDDDKVQNDRFWECTNPTMFSKANQEQTNKFK